MYLAVGFLYLCFFLHFELCLGGNWIPFPSIGFYAPKKVTGLGYNIVDEVSQVIHPMNNSVLLSVLKCDQYICICHHFVLLLKAANGELWGKQYLE